MRTRIHQSQRVIHQGRRVPAKRRSLPLFYGVVGVIATLAAVLAALLLARPAALPTTADITIPETINAPTGRTPEGFFFKGSPDAPVTVVEYGDYQCPACAVFATRVEAEINRTYVEMGKVRLVFHDYPLPQHQNAVKTAEAARCAGDQNQYWPMHDVLYTRQAEWESDRNIAPRLVGYARAIGLDSERFATCLDEGVYTAAVQGAATAAQLAGITSTPTFVIDGQQVAAARLQAAIEQALRARKQ